MEIVKRNQLIEVDPEKISGGLNDVKSGRPLRAAVERGFDVFITVDQCLRFQNLSQFNLLSLSL